MLDYKELRVYSTPWCPDCKRALSFLKEFKIPYTLVDIDKNEEAAHYLEKETGKKAIPHFYLDGQWIKPYTPGRGFNREDMRQLFKV